jgi:hypothetical protein
MFLALEHPALSSRRYTKQNEGQGLTSAINESNLIADLAKEADLPLRKSEEISGSATEDYRQNAALKEGRCEKALRP